jgi:hypothetical protein
LTQPGPQTAAYATAIIPTWEDAETWITVGVPPFASQGEAFYIYRLRQKHNKDCRVGPIVEEGGSVGP